MIYVDNAATTPLDQGALKAMMPYLIENFGNASQSYTFSRSSRKGLKQAREMIANCIGASPEEIYFTACGTESNNWVLRGVTEKSRRSGRIITSKIEHHAILNTLKAVVQQGMGYELLPVSQSAFIDPQELINVITSETTLASIMMVNNEIGTIQPIREFVEICNKYGVPMHTDAVQAIGHIPIDVHELGVSYLSASGHKFNGPKGIGFLYMRKGFELPALITGGAQERCLRAGTENVAAIVGMAVALENHCQALHTERQTLKKLENVLLQELNMLGVDYTRNGGVNQIPGILSLSFPHIEGERLLHRLDLMGICVSTGSACDSKNTKISHVLEAMGLSLEKAKGTIRISLGRQNTFEDMHNISLAIQKVCT